MSEGMKSKDDVHFFTPAEEKQSTKSDRSRNGGKSSPRKPAAATAIVKSKLRGEGREIDHTAALNRKTHQKELAQKLQADGEEKYAADGGNGKVKEKPWKRYESYARDTQLPENVITQRVRCSILPISLVCVGPLLIANSDGYSIA